MNDAPTARPGSRFPKASRLLRRPEFTRVFDSGFRVQGRFMTLVLSSNEAGHGRLGIIASRKLGDAVRRNRAKRLLREVFRQTHSMTRSPGLDVVVIPRRELFDAPYPALENDFRGALRRGASRLSGHVSR